MESDKVESQVQNGSANFEDDMLRSRYGLYYVCRNKL